MEISNVFPPVFPSFPSVLLLSTHCGGGARRGCRTHSLKFDVENPTPLSMFQLIVDYLNSVPTNADGTPMYVTPCDFLST